MNRDALEQVYRISEMVCEPPRVNEIDSNPLTVDETGAIALDARITLVWNTLAVIRAMATWRSIRIRPA